MQASASTSKLLKMIILALMGAISLVLFFLNFPLPFLPAYLKIDFSEVPALIAALIFSPVAGIIVEGIKNLLYLVITGAGDPVGVVANFLAGILFILPVSYLYHRYKNVKGIVSGIVAGTIIMALAMSLLNYLVILPVYAWFMGMEEMNIESVKRAAVLAGILPFNILKGIIVGLLFLPLYTKLRSWIEQKSARFIAD
ncbi:ECF transporter S component [Virgibacillus sp. 179-BFC.A HS]|uniref:Riboflavin transporter n=1 Tax=Tigheibacillus jepli TaxID=3035914 RepID=A0ABU5CIB5_9BACI|nr:ECF transporter S component [Virgibacillus sp. 179-BFC.A HS]MDY0405263.1 ECF transporter S component [Virgibacillus sp. 179-BFC.A HS]